MEIISENPETPRKIRVIDGVCGIGKSTYSIELIKQLTNDASSFTKSSNKVIYVTPYIDECVKMGQFTTEKNKQGKYTPKRDEYFRLSYNLEKAIFKFRFNTNINSYKSASEAILELLKKNENLVITHSSFEKFNSEINQEINARNYHLIIDEAPTPVRSINLTKKLDIDSFNTLKSIKFLELTSGKYKHDEVIYTGDTNSITLERYKDLKSELLSGICFYTGEDKTKNSPNIIWTQLEETYTSPKTVSVLTYLYNGTVFSSYAELFNLSIDHYDMTIDKYVTSFKFKVYDYEILINSVIPSGTKTNIFNKKRTGKGDYLTSGWYTEKATSLKLKEEYGIGYKPNVKSKKDPEIKELKLKTNNFFKAPLKANSELKNINKNILKDYRNAGLIYGDYEVFIQNLENEIKDEKVSMNEKLWTVLKPFKRVLLEDQTSINEDRFLSYNMKAVNQYRNVKSLAYLVNVHPHVSLTSFLSANGVILNVDDFATSEMIQWIFRSRIRSGKKIQVFIASYRMRYLLNKWIHDFTTKTNLKTKHYKVSDDKTFFNDKFAIPWALLPKVTAIDRIRLSTKLN
jgi:hypothetical protein